MDTTLTIGTKIIYGRAVINIVDMDESTITCQFPDGTTKVILISDPLIIKMKLDDGSK
jgi:hypothetical protein